MPVLDHAVPLALQRQIHMEALAKAKEQRERRLNTDLLRLPEGLSREELLLLLEAHPEIGPRIIFALNELDQSPPKDDNPNPASALFSDHES